MGPPRARRLKHLVAGSHAREFVSSVGFGLFAYALALLSGPALSRALGADGKGEQAFVLVITQTVIGISLSGIPNAAYFYLDKTDLRRLAGTAYAVGLAALTLISVPVWFILPQLADADQYGSSVITWARIGLVANACHVLASCALGIRHAFGTGWRFNVIKYSSQVVSGLGVAALFVLSELTLRSALLATVVAPAAVSLLVPFTLRGSWPIGFDRRLIRPIAAYAVRALGGVIAIMAVNNADKLILGSIEISRLGVYSVAASASSVLVPIGFGAASTVLSQLRREGQRPGAVLRRTVKGTAVIAVLTAVVVGATSPWLLPLVFGSDFEGAVVPLLLLLPGVVMMALENVLQSYLYAMGYPGRATRSALIGGIVMVIVVAPAVHAWSMNGAAIATTSSLLVQFVVTSRTVRSVGDRRADAKPGPSGQ